MEASGSNAKTIRFIDPNGRKSSTFIVSSRSTVEIGACTFSRDDLLLAMGVSMEEVKNLEAHRFSKVPLGDEESKVAHR